MTRPSPGALIGALLGIVLTITQTPALADTQAGKDESARANALFDDIFDRRVQRDPVFQTYQGIKDDYDKWNDLSEAAQAKEQEHVRQDLERLRGIDTSQLDVATLLSYRLMERELQEQIADYKWRHHSYPVNQMRGEHAQIPAFLINQHQVSSIEDAQAYIARLNGVAVRLAQVIEQLEIREELGIIAPDFVLPHVLRTSRNVLRGAPFEEGEPSTLLADFTAKVEALDISDAERDKLLRDAELALINSVQAGYLALITAVEKLQKKATHDAGVWKFPNGEAFYSNRLQHITTTELTAAEIHEIGLQEVARIHDEMRAIRDQVGFKGDLKSFMDFMRTDEQFYYPNTDEGREQYLERVDAVLADMDSRLDELFLVRPQAELIVKAVEPFRERAAGKAFYQRPAADGSRPGTYFANLYDMSMMPTYKLEALAYHEGLPGHHMQISIKQELKDLPRFRRFGGVTAYSEGWGLYSELLPKEIGLYQDPYSDFGRLAMELWRAVRLVVDTGMHAMKWTREECIAYYLENTPNAEIDAVKMVERHAVMPAQATAYKIGMIRILELRERARGALAEDFDIREFHDVVLRQAAVPMDVLAEQVEAYINDKQREKAKAS